MKSGRLFWGFFLLTLGTLFLVTKYTSLEINFDFVWDMWPLIFVFWGVAVIVKDTWGKPILSSILGIFIGLMVFGIPYNTFWNINSDFDFDKDLALNENYLEDWDPSIKKATLTINSGVGSFVINNSTDKLIEGYGKGSLANYDFKVEKFDSIADVYFSLEEQGKWFGRKLRNNLMLNLNENPVWDIELNLGAARSKFDLSNFKIRDLELHTGATNTTITLGDKYPSTDVKIEMGASSITIRIPKSSGCSFKGETAIVSKSLIGFIKRDSGYSETENFDTAENKIYISVDGGVSSVKVVRY
jgi:hypothetical protein